MIIPYGIHDVHGTMNWLWSQPTLNPWIPHGIPHGFHGFQVDSIWIIPGKVKTSIMAVSMLRCTNMTLPFLMGPYDWPLHPQHFSLKAPWLVFFHQLPAGIANWRMYFSSWFPCVLYFFISYLGKGRLDSEFVRWLFDRAHFPGAAIMLTILCMNPDSADPT